MIQALRKTKTGEVTLQPRVFLHPNLISYLHKKGTACFYRHALHIECALKWQHVLHMALNFRPSMLSSQQSWLIKIQLSLVSNHGKINRQRWGDKLTKNTLYGVEGWGFWNRVSQLIVTLLPGLSQAAITNYHAQLLQRNELNLVYGQLGYGSKANNNRLFDGNLCWLAQQYWNFDHYVPTHKIHKFFEFSNNRWFIFIACFRATMPFIHFARKLRF